MTGLEPVRRSTHAPQTCLSTSSSTLALISRGEPLVSQRQDILYQGYPPLSTKFAKKACNWIIGDVSAYLNKNNLSFAKVPCSSENLASLINVIEAGEISVKQGKVVFEEVMQGKDPKKVIEEKGMKQVSDDGAILAIIDAIIAANADKVAEYKSGKDKLFGFFVGQTMKESKGTANPAKVNELLKSRLDA